MKYCTTCGAGLAEDAAFCTVCGTPCGMAEKTSQNMQSGGFFNKAGSLTQETVPEQQGNPMDEQFSAEPELEIKEQTKKLPKDKKPMSKGKKIFLGITLLLLIAVVTAGALFLRWYNSPEQETLRALEAGDYEGAAAVLNENPQVQEEEAVWEQLNSRIAVLKTSYGDDSMAYEDAMEELGAIQALRITELDKEISQVREYIERVQMSRMRFDQAEEAFNTGDYVAAWSFYNAVIEEDFNYETARSKIPQTEDLYRKAVLEQAKTYAEGKDYASALNVLNEARKILQDDEAILDKIATYEEENAAHKKTSVLSLAADFAQKKEYLKAYEAVKGLSSQMPDDSDVKAAIQKYRGLYEEQVVAQAATLEAERKYDEALSLLRTAKQKCSDSTVISQKLNEINNRKPVSITTLTAINSENWSKWNDGTPRDPFGNSYANKNNFAIIAATWRGGVHSTEYRVDEKYDLIFFTIAPNENFNKDNYAYVQVYVDDVLRYTSPKITQKTQPFTIPSVDISDADYIKIVVTNGGDTGVLLTDVMLQKNPEHVSTQDKNYTSLNLLDFFNGELPWNNKFPEDVHGNDYGKAQNYSYITCSWRGGESYGEFYLGKAYTSLSFSAAPTAQMQLDSKAVLKVYVDDKLMYTSDTITQKTSLFKVENIDLSGASYLKIVIEMTNECGIILSDLLLRNN